MRQIGSGASSALQEPRRFEAWVEPSLLGLVCDVALSTASCALQGTANGRLIGVPASHLGRAELARLPSCVKLEAEQAALYKNRGGSRPWVEPSLLGLVCDVALSAASCALQGTANGGLIGVPRSRLGRAELARLQSCGKHPAEQAPICKAAPNPKPEIRVRNHPQKSRRHRAAPAGWRSVPACC